MSCFIINNKTASSIVTALIEMEHIHEFEAQSLLNLMMQVNRASVNSRYSENELAPNYIFEKQNIIFNDVNEEDESKIYRSVMQMITNIQFFKYQSCEIEYFEKTLIFKILQKLQDELIHHFKSWLVQSRYESWESSKDKAYHQLRFSDECTWGLDD